MRPRNYNHCFVECGKENLRAAGCKLKCRISQKEKSYNSFSNLFNSQLRDDDTRTRMTDGQRLMSIS